MIKLVYLLLALYVIHVFTLKWAKRMEDCIVKSKFQIAERIGQEGIATCLSECQIMSLCQSVSWYQFNKTCRLFKRSVLDDKREEYRHWIALDEWETFSKVQYPVAIRMKDGNPIGKFDEAVQICLARFSTIATPDDLLEARQLNMGECYCGWLSNGLMGLVTPPENFCEKYNFSTSIVYCKQAMAIAWCKLK